MSAEGADFTRRSKRTRTPSQVARASSDSTQREEGDDARRAAPRPATARPTAAEAAVARSLFDRMKCELRSMRQSRFEGDLQAFACALAIRSGEFALDAHTLRAAFGMRSSDDRYAHAGRDLRTWLARFDEFHVLHPDELPNRQLAERPQPLGWEQGVWPRVLPRLLAVAVLVVLRLVSTRGEHLRKVTASVSSTAAHTPIGDLQCSRRPTWEASYDPSVWRPNLSSSPYTEVWLAHPFLASRQTRSARFSSRLTAIQTSIVASCSGLRCSAIPSRRQGCTSTSQHSVASRRASCSQGGPACAATDRAGTGETSGAGTIVPSPSTRRRASR